MQVAVVGERRCGKTSLAEALRRSAAAREATATSDSSTDPVDDSSTDPVDDSSTDPVDDSSTDPVDELAGAGSGWCRLDVVDLSAGRHLDVYGRGLDVDAYILAFRPPTALQVPRASSGVCSLTSWSSCSLTCWSLARDVDAYILAFDVTSIQAAGSAHHNGTAAALTSRHAARLQMWLQALYEVRIKVKKLI